MIKLLFAFVLYKNKRTNLLLQIRDGFSGDIILDQIKSFQLGTTIIGTSNSITVFLRTENFNHLENWKITWSGRCIELNREWLKRSNVNYFLVLSRLMIR